MGLWDKIKSVKNMVTGRGAQVFVTVDEEPAMGEPFKVYIKAIIKDADLKIDKVYLNIKAEERVTVYDVDVFRNDEVYTEEVTNITETYRSEDVVSGPETLEANKEYNWEFEVVLSDDLSSTYHGENAIHEWKFFAGLDAFGNDPDSGWITVDIW